ncbi:hypothetical protein SE17_22760 [Kouleothrix aurantiaca]|uniref:Uncharacterized protein n=1 Tax=Kouleothrix aurantiaca TaxID=186479 RepID=A0A0P9DM81_9CHLR|nr:hypothetical protein SE17_22760 [Kouleothrix aurantiaca]
MKRFLFGVIGAAIVVLIGLFFASKLWSLPTDDVRTGLRGRTLFIIRPWPDDGTLSQIWIEDDGTVTRGILSSNTRTHGQVNTAHMEQLQHVREDWCAHPPQIQATTSTERRYELGVNCHSLADQLNGRSDQRLIIGFEQLPLVLQSVVSE